MTNGQRTEWWQHYMVLSSEPQQKVTWTAALGLYFYMLKQYRRLLRSTMAKHNTDIGK